MDTFEVLSLILSFGMFVIGVLEFNDQDKSS
ncbi:putative holin-like toxin [Peribacillus loiseleuriae]